MILFTLTRGKEAVSTSGTYCKLHKSQSGARAAGEVSWKAIMEEEHGQKAKILAGFQHTEFSTGSFCFCLFVSPRVCISMIHCHPKNGLFFDVVKMISLSTTNIV